jgi:hypothetical protein
MALVSIHLSSNRPAQLSEFARRLEASADEASDVEVVVHVDSEDGAMLELMPRLAARHRIALKWIARPSEGFHGLWRAYDDLLRASDPSAYFLMCLNDEMFFATEKWDTKLRRYVGLFPDHIFRLRTSDKRHRNYYDYWEAGFASDRSAITTRRWVTLGGGWCPCDGPESFQQCVAYYFGWLHRFNANRPYRDLPIDDIQLAGPCANRVPDGPRPREGLCGGVGAWFTLMSHAMQEEAARRAQVLHAHIAAEAEPGEPGRLGVRTNAFRKRVEIRDTATRRVVRAFPYGLSRLRIWATNQLRKSNYPYYGGGAGRVSAMRNARTTRRENR